MAATAVGACAIRTAVAAAADGYRDTGRAAAPAGGGGIWKAVVPPPGTMHGQFDNNDPVGLAAGVRIAADCSINWVDPDAGKLYCFSSATSLVVFLDAPHAYLERARTQWLSLGGSVIRERRGSCRDPSTRSAALPPTDHS
jgi:hypothetical protein